MVSGSPLFVTALLLASVLFCTCDLSLVDGDADGGVYRQRRNPYGEQAATCQRAATNMLNQVSCEPADISSVPFFFITGHLCYNCTETSIDYIPCTKTVTQKADGIRVAYWLRGYNYGICYVICKADCPTSG